MFRSLTAQKDPAVAGAVNVTRIIDTVRSLGLIIVFVTVCLAHPRPSLAGVRGTAIAVTLGICVLAWVLWLLGDRRSRMLVPGLIGMGAAGGVLAALSLRTAQRSPSAAWPPSAQRSTCARRPRWASRRRR